MRNLSRMSFLRDVHQCARSLAKSPSLPAVAILSLGLGIGVNTTLFSLFKSLFLDEISAAQPGRLVRTWVGGMNRMSYANFRDLENSRAFRGWAGYTMAPFTLRTGEQGSKIWGQIVTPNFFDVLGVKTASGRTFSNDEQAAVLSHAFWRQRFEGASDAIGRTINLNNQTYTIVGVLPEGYRSVLGFGVSPQVYVPFSTILNRDLMERSRTGTLEAFGRLAPGVTEMQAKSALLAGAQELKRLYPKENEFLDKVELFPMSGLGRVKAKGYPTPLAVFSIALLVISGLVLLIACANVSGLFWRAD